MPKFFVRWEKNGQKLSGPFSAETRESAEQYIKENIPDATCIYAQSMAGHLDDKIRDHIQKVKLSEKLSDQEYIGQIRERLRACADAALMFGEASQESLERTLSRMVDCQYEITGLDGHMFSFGFKSNAFWGGIIFHCSCKEWAIHT